MEGRSRAPTPGDPGNRRGYFMHIAHVPQAFGQGASRRLQRALWAAAALLCGCAGMSNTDRGVLGGGALGAGAGAAIGSLTGHTGAGAAIGAVTGAVTGGLVGNAADESERRRAAQLAAANARPPMSLEEIATLAQQHVSDDVIISQIHTTGSAYNLTADQIVWLKQVGVSDRVVEEMQLTTRFPRRVYTAVPVYPDPVYVVEPPPPPVHVGIGFGFGRWH
jgi:hypothetical protein